MAAAALGGLLSGILSPSDSESTSTGSSWDKSENWSNSSGSSFEEAGSLAESLANSWTNAKEANLNSHDEAELARLYQTYMSNTAYQRAVNDLKKAGLNPIMAFYNGGTGASTPSGAMAQSFMNSYSTSSSKSSSYQRGGSSQSSSSYGYSKGRSKNNSHSESSTGLHNWTKKDRLNQTVGGLTEAGMNLTGTVLGSIWSWATNEANKMINK